MKATLTGNKRRLKELARRHGTPLMTISRSALRGQLERFRRVLPRVEPFFAIKANAHPEVLKTMVAGRAGFDVASAAEMSQVLAAGAKPDGIIFANTIKPADAIALAARKGVTLMTFDSGYELDKIAQHAPGVASQAPPNRAPNHLMISSLSFATVVIPPAMTRAT